MYPVGKSRTDHPIYAAFITLPLTKSDKEELGWSLAVKSVSFLLSLILIFLVSLYRHIQGQVGLFFLPVFNRAIRNVLQMGLLTGLFCEGKKSV